MYIGRDEYPVNTTTAYGLLQSTSSTIDGQPDSGCTHGQRFRNHLSNVMFTQKGRKSTSDSNTAVPGRDSKIHIIGVKNLKVETNTLFASE